MFFFAYLGAPTGGPRWRDVLSRRAAWLGLQAHTFSRTLADGRAFAFGWVCVRPSDTAALVREDGSRLTIIPLDTLTRGEALVQDSPRGFETNAIRVDVSLLSGEARVAVPILTVEPFYYAGDGGDWAFGNDLRLMVDWAGLRLHALAAHSMFQYDYVPPPYTLSETVRRVRPGHVFTLSPDGSPSEWQFFRPADMIAPPDDGEPVERVGHALDSVLGQVGRPAAVHFSGGVDSGLIAARLAALGRTDVRLHNFTAGPQSDPFYNLAQDMANHVGLPCDRVLWNPAAISDMLEDLAREYAVPVPDPAFLPALALVRDAEQWDEAPVMVATGTSAGHPFDTGFRLGPWRKVYAVPYPLRYLGAVAYRLWFWKRQGTAARATSTLQRSMEFTVMQNAAFLHGTLRGFAYDAPPDVRAAMRDVVEKAQMGPTEGMTSEDRVAMAAMLRHGTHM
ncbi:MAG: asparagine synthase-related protein [Anaerolineae bacterium]|nr:asparagine synthase-related protein [Anaerolineae bacterium]